MNKKQAKVKALDILIAMIYQEVISPTDFTLEFSEADRKKVQTALDELGDQLSRRYEKLTDQHKQKQALGGEACFC